MPTKPSSIKRKQYLASISSTSQLIDSCTRCPMAAFTSKSSTGLALALCFLVVIMSLAQVTMVHGRKAPVAAAAATTDKKQTEGLDLAEGTVLIPGIGRTVIGSFELPSIGGLDHSGPAAANAQYIPGADDTFVPNPGFEVPNPFRGGSVP